jgi:hypothetical protein
MIRHPLPIVVINAPDRDWRADHIFGHIACHTLILRGDSPLLHVRHQAIGILPETGIHQLVDRLGLQRLTEHRQ